jgi:hypothetical protein
MADLPLIVFDVNETLLDLGTLEPTFQRIFGDKSAMRLWFANLILYSAALTVAGVYVPFTDIGAAVMKMLADTRGITINDNDKKELADKFSTMPPRRPRGGPSVVRPSPGVNRPAAARARMTGRAAAAYGTTHSGRPCAAAHRGARIPR